jgi:hypothetical protein
LTLASEERHCEAAAQECELLISDRSTGTVTYRLDQLTQGLREALEPLIFSAVPFIVQGRFVLDDQNSTHIAAGGTARNLSHALSVVPPGRRVNGRDAALFEQQLIEMNPAIAYYSDRFSL